MPEKENDIKGVNFIEELEKISSTIQKIGMQFCSSQFVSGIKKFYKQLCNIISSGHFESFMHTANKSTPLRHRRGVKIKVQPMAVARKKRKILSKKAGQHQISHRIYVFICLVEIIFFAMYFQSL